MKVPSRPGYGYDNGGSRAEPRDNVTFLCGTRTTVGKPCTRAATHQAGGKGMCSFHFGRYIDAILKK